MSTCCFDWFLIDRLSIAFQLTPYLDEELYGKVVATVVRGNVVYDDGEFSKEPLGQLLLKDDFLVTIR